MRAVVARDANRLVGTTRGGRQRPHKTKVN